MIDQNNQQLSQDGEARKKAMLSELVGQMNNVHKVRQLRRRVLHTLTFIIVCAITVWVVSIQYSSPQVPKRVELPTGSGTNIELPNTPLIKIINDDELIALLAKINRPAGMVRSEGRIWLTNAVTDDELGISQDNPDEDPSSM